MSLLTKTVVVNLVLVLIGSTPSGFLAAVT